MKLLLIPLIISLTGVQAQPGLVVTSLPEVLFQSNGGVHDVVAGSVIQLYCSVQSTTASFFWTKDGSPLVMDVPHLRERTYNDSTNATSVLTVDNFQSGDNGTYQCRAVNGNNTGFGDSTVLRVVINGSLTVLYQPIEDEPSFDETHSNRQIEDNRTGIRLGSTVSMNCAAEYSIETSSPIQLQWIRSGKTVIADSSHSIINKINLNSSLQIANFSSYDAGVYQCIINTETELAITTPYKLQTDIIYQGINTIFIERISPEIIFLRPPEKLVIEVKATGRYRQILWLKNGVVHIVQPQQFPNYNEMLVYDTTTHEDLGLYEVSLRPTNVATQRNVPSELDFMVLSPVDANTTITNGSGIVIREGESIIISCISTGFPTPSISWELNGEPVPFQSTELVTVGQATATVQFIRDGHGNLVPDITLGNITSNLVVVNAQYPDHDGVYVCTGSNDKSMVNISSARINVLVIVPPEVEVIASSSMGGSTTLFCNVTRTNPGVVGKYIWRKEETGVRILENSDTLLLNVSVVSDFGTYSCTVTNSAGALGRGNTTLTQPFTTKSFLQLRISPVDNCVSWTERNHDQKQADIIEHIIKIINRACSCGLTANHITESVFSCRSSETQVVFKAHISYTSSVETYSADDLVMFISLWVSNGPSLTVTGTVFNVDSTCPTQLESLTDEDCVNPNSPVNDSVSLNITIIWASILGGGVVVVMVITVTVILLIWYARQRRKSLSSSHELQLQSVTEKSVAAPVYETIPTFNEDNLTVEPNTAYGTHAAAVEPNIAYKTTGFQQQKSSESVDPNISMFQEVDGEEPVYD